jgi:hypothetical protein
VLRDVQVVLSVLRLAYLTNDAALGAANSHAALLPALTACVPLRAAVAAALVALASRPFDSARPSSSDGDEPSRARGPSSPRDTIAAALTQLLTRGRLVAPGDAGGGCFGSDAAPARALAGALAAQYAAGGDACPVFGAAVLLMLRDDLREVSGAAFEALRGARCLHALPALAACVGPPATYLHAAAGAIAADVRAARRGASGSGDAPSAAPAGMGTWWQDAQEALRHGTLDARAVARLAGTIAFGGAACDTPAGAVLVGAAALSLVTAACAAALRAQGSGAGGALDTRGGVGAPQAENEDPSATAAGDGARLVCLGAQALEDCNLLSIEDVAALLDTASAAGENTCDAAVIEIVGVAAARLAAMLRASSVVGT